MKNYTAVVERCPATGHYIGYIPGFPGAHSQAKNRSELQSNLREVLSMLLEDGDPRPASEFVGMLTISVG